MNISNAYADFKEHARTNPKLLSSLTDTPDDEWVFGQFFRLQLPQIADPTLWDFDCAWSDVCYYITTSCRAYGLSITKEHCPLILSFLYHHCFERFIFLWKKYLIPSTWKLVYDQKFGEGIWVMKPPNKIDK